MKKLSVVVTDSFLLEPITYSLWTDFTFRIKFSIRVIKTFELSNHAHITRKVNFYIKALIYANIYGEKKKSQKPAIKISKVNASSSSSRVEIKCKKEL